MVLYLFIIYKGKKKFSNLYRSGEKLKCERRKGGTAPAVDPLCFLWQNGAL